MKILKFNAAILLFGFLSVFFQLQANQGNPYENTIFRATLGETFAAEIKNGELYAWGNNIFGQLGLGDTLPKTGVFKVNTETDWKQISAGTNHALAIKTDGTLWAWGANQSGQLGTGDLSKRNTPTQIAQTKRWIYVQAAQNHSIALTSDGELWTWGDNSFGQLGTGNTQNQSSPVQVGNNFDWTQISSKGNFCLAKKVDGTIWAWGENQPIQVFYLLSKLEEMIHGKRYLQEKIMQVQSLLMERFFCGETIAKIKSILHQTEVLTFLKK
jgi:alpha-tubulin suppressor-like RCC1 family protein